MTRGGGKAGKTSRSKAGEGRHAIHSKAGQVDHGNGSRVRSLWKLDIVMHKK